MTINHFLDTILTSKGKDREDRPRIRLQVFIAAVFLLIMIFAAPFVGTVYAEGETTPEPTPTEEISPEPTDENPGDDSAPEASPTPAVSPTPEPDLICDETADDPEETSCESSSPPTEVEVVEEASIPDAAFHDPYFVRDSQVYTFLPLDDDCSSSANPTLCVLSLAPIQAAIDDIVLLGAPDDHIINVDGGTYEGDLSVDGDLSLALNGLTLQATGLNGDPYLIGTVELRNLLGFNFVGLGVNGEITVADSSQVNIEGTDSDDIIHIILEGQVNELSVDGKDGADEITLDASEADPGSTAVVNDTGTNPVDSDSVKVKAGSDDDTVQLSAAQILVGTTAPVAVGLDEIENVAVDGGEGYDTIYGPAVSSTWIIDGSNSGEVNGIKLDSFENLVGAADYENYFIILPGGSISGLVEGGSSEDTLDYSAYDTSVAVDLSAGTASDIAGFINIEHIVGGMATDTLIGPDADTTWNLTGLNTGDVVGISFVAIENLYGGTGTDTFIFDGGSFASVDGGGGTDTLDYSVYSSDVTVDLSLGIAPDLGAFFNIEHFVGGTGNDLFIGPDADLTWDLSAPYAGNVADISFTDIENLHGGTGADTFILSDGSYDAIDGGGGADTLDYSTYLGSVTIDLITSVATAVGSFAGIVQILGGSGVDTLFGPDEESIWTLTGVNSGTVKEISFAEIENLFGGSGADTFVFDGGSAGVIDGGSGSDALDYSAYTTSVAVDLAVGTATAVGGFANIENIMGGFGFDTLVGPDVDATWEIISPNAGSVAGVSFTYIETLSGGFGDDAFVFSGGSIVGLVDGGAGADTLNYADYTTGIIIDLSSSTATALGGFADFENVIGGSGSDTILGPDADATWTIGGPNAVIIEGIYFAEIENLFGGSGDDAFVFSGGSVVSLDGGAGSDTMDYAVYNTGITVDLAAGSATAVAGFENIEYIIGGSAVDTLVGPDVDAAWNLSAPNAGDVAGITYAEIENIVGGSGADAFVFAGGSFAAIDGGAGTDTLDYSALSTGMVVDMGSGFPADIETVIGTGHVDELIGPSANTAWTLAGTDAGTAGDITFTDFENLTGAADNEDTFVVYASGRLSGLLDGGAGGFDTLVFEGGSFDTVISTTTGPNSGTIERDGDVFTYAGLEPITDNSNTTNRVIDLSDFSDTATLTESAGQLTVADSDPFGIWTFESVTFAKPSVSLTINLGSSNDNILTDPDEPIPFISRDLLTIDGTGSAINLTGVDLNVNGEDGKDEVTISGSLTVDELIVNAEKITVSSGAAVTANTITFVAVDEDDGAVDEDGEYLGGIFEGLYIAIPEALIDLTGSNITAVSDVTLVATATVNITATPSTLGSTVDASLLTILPNAGVIFGGTNLTAASLDADANINVTVSFEDDADGSDTDTTSDAAVTIVVVVAGAETVVQGSSTIAISGNVELNAATTLNIASTADGSGGTAGATLAVTEVQADTKAFVTDSASIVANGGDTPDSIEIGATLTSNVATSATATANGADDGGGTNQSEQRLADPNQDSDTSDQAQTSDGSVSFAGAVVVTDYRPLTEVYLDTSGIVISAGNITLSSMVTDTVTSTADATNTSSGGTGVGVAVAIGIVDSQTLAWIGGSGSLTADAVLLNANLDADNTYKVEATSGIGDSSKTGVAGALAIQVVTPTVKAYVDGLSMVNLNGASLSVTANSQVKIETNAVPDEDGSSGESLGVGASVALTISDIQTQAYIADGGLVMNAEDITIDANAIHKTTTKAVGAAEASGSLAITPVVAITILLGMTSANISTGSVLTLSGDLKVKSSHDSDSKTKAEGDAEGASTAIGASLALTIDEQMTEVKLTRDVSLPSGALSLEAAGQFRSHSSADAAASGAEEDDGGNPDGVNDQSQGQTNFANSQAAGRTGSGSSSTTAPDASSSGGTVSVAAAISINIADNAVTALIGDGVTVTADGAVSLVVTSNQDSWAVADGSASNGASATVGAAVALNVANLDVIATTGASTITADGLTVSSTMASREMDLDISSEDIVLTADDTIYVGEPEGLTTGEKVKYNNGGGSDIGGLTSGTDYYVIKEDGGKIKLATMMAQSLI